MTETRASAPPATWLLRLYVNGASPHSVAAIENVQRICDEELAGRVDFRVIDVRTEPTQVLRDNVLVAPTLVKRLPAPVRRVVGDLANADRVRQALEIGPIVPVPHGIG
jgi:circadian clock protein KaiB